MENPEIDYIVCVKPTTRIAVGERFLLKAYPQVNGKVLIGGYWISLSRFNIVKDAGHIPEQQSLAELLKIHQGDKPIGTCSYAMRPYNGNDIFKINDICHARIVQDTIIKQVVLLVEPYIKRVEQWRGDSEHYTRAVNYILYRSPWSSIFINPDYRNNYGCVELDTNRGVNAVASAAIALRTCSEFYALNTIFCNLIDAGVSEHVAYIIAHQCGTGVGNNSGAHHIFDNLVTIDSIKDFFNTGKFMDEGPKYNNQPHKRYTIIESQFSKDYHNNDTIGIVLTNYAKECNTITKINRWGEQVYSWKHPNNLIPIAYKFEEEYFNA